MLVFNGGLHLRVSYMDGRLQRKLTPQILFYKEFSQLTAMRFFHALPFINNQDFTPF